MSQSDNEWRVTGEPEVEEEAGYIEEFDITAVPNDFNVLTIVSFIDKGSIRIPGFQRNYVWELPRASRLIESLLLGLPVPQVFLYQKEKGPLLLIDGQQRLMTLYYYLHGRFPRRDARVKIRDIFDERGSLPEESLQDDALFADFALSLKAPDGETDRQSRFHGKKYATLGDDQESLALRTIRNVVIKQTRPPGDHSSMFEVFNRLNSGGMNLSPQELRMSLYDSAFLKLLLKLNRRAAWRRLVLAPEPDVRFRDVEVLLRAFAMGLWAENYRPSMERFLNRFAAHCEKLTATQLGQYESVFDEFLAATADLPDRAFAVQGTARFNVVLFDAVFAASILGRLTNGSAIRPLDAVQITALDADYEFKQALLEGTTKVERVKTRLQRARSILA